MGGRGLVEAIYTTTIYFTFTEGLILPALPELVGCFCGMSLSSGSPTTTALPSYLHDTEVLWLSTNSTSVGHFIGSTVPTHGNLRPFRGKSLTRRTDPPYLHNEKVANTLTRES